MHQSDYPTDLWVECKSGRKCTFSIQNKCNCFGKQVFFNRACSGGKLVYMSMVTYPYTNLKVANNRSIFTKDWEASHQKSTLCPINCTINIRDLTQGWHWCQWECCLKVSFPGNKLLNLKQNKLSFANVTPIRPTWQYWMKEPNKVIMWWEVTLSSQALVFAYQHWHVFYWMKYH